MYDESQNQDDLELVRRFQKGDAEAFKDLYNQCYGLVRNYCLKIVKNESDADELAQKTFLQVMEKANCFDPDKEGSDFRKWLTTIACHMSFNHLADKSQDRKAQQWALEEGNIRTGRETRPESQVIHKEYSQIVLAAIHKLPEPIRQCFACHYILGVKYSDLCQIYGLKQHQLSYLIASGQEKLSRELRAHA